MISVIVPVYNVEPYLRQCIDSILAQTYTDFELILVDDGSTDNCGAICDECAKHDDRIRVIHQENGGVSAARNTGIDAARGDYIAFVDSDDVVSSLYLRTLFRLIDENGADISVCMTQNFQENVSPSESSGKTCILSGREACLSIYHFSGILWVSACAKLYKSELFVGIRFPVGYIHEDQAIIPKLLYNAKRVAITQDKLYGYRQSRGSIMRSGFSMKQFHAIDALKNCNAYFEDKCDTELIQASAAFLKVVWAEQILKAVSAKAWKTIPEQYKMSELKAWKILRKNASHDKFVWFLKQIHPMWVKPYCYAKSLMAKIKPF